MEYILGIDTGGTYTDGVLVEAISKKVCCKAKALTTKENLVIGINNCIEALSIEDVSEIEMVCISTTLATNAVVEDKGCRAGLIVLGKNIKKTLPTQVCYFVNGLFTIQGKLEYDLDEEGVKKAFLHMREKIDALVISGYASTRNPEHELRAKAMIGEMSDIPVVCAHEITGKLGYYERTVTALLNARLIPIIKELINDTKIVLRQRGISAPLMVVKGDGSFMTGKSAEEKPIETILSGPAASVIGTMHLAELKDATVIDIGGTTSDIASVKDGCVDIREDGAIVGTWRTHVMAADIYTHGIGGDSKLRIDEAGNLTFGPDKTTPISLLLNDEKSDDKILKKVKQVIGEDSNAEGGFTPTDLAHVIGIYDKWNNKAADAAIDVLCDRLECDRETCIVRVENAFFNTIKKALDDSGKMKDNVPIIAIGAPSHAWMPQIAAQYGFTSFVPENADVANAIGAAVGRIEEKFEVIIRQDKSDGQYIGFLNIRREEFSSLEEAKTVCICEAKRIVEERVKEANCADYEILEDVEDVYCDTYGGEESIYIETKIRVVAAGDPECISTKTK